ncbi:amino acid adenylation domain-containing protein [Streptomyces sp. QH1-20]|uniref:amino acid adenylation domain-containing protein n=1 Tax=Streptomyces sp. QH1-20 TaxID=3240934 RepID=UPI003519668E
MSTSTTVPSAVERARFATPGVHRLVEDQARRTPHAAAVLCGDQCLDYAELDRRADRLARRLRRHGVGPEVRVGIHLARSVELAVAVLAVLKAGGVCVPLDPGYPRDRLVFILDDVAAPILLTRRHPASGPATDYPGTVVHPDDASDDAPDDAPEAGTRPAESRPLHPDNLAWVAYTSGSTGTPKGVGLTHGPLANLALEVGRRLGLGPGDRVLQFASIGFSVAAEEILSTWVTGACLVLDPEESLADSARLRAVVDTQGVTVMQLTPAYWYEWSRELERDGLPRPPTSLRLLVVGSEAVAVEAVAAWLPTGVRLVQEYGATEGTISQLLYEATGPAADVGTWSRVPVGTPLGGVRAHVLDEWLRPAPDGRPGELYIAGDSVSRGYLGRPGMTAERFLADPYGDRPGSRMYRTGDLVRRLADGNLEFLGRIDHQIKIRGIRIEPGEVESVIRRHPGVTECAVLARKTAAGTDQLCACVVGEAGQDDAGLRAYLTTQLAPALVPSRIVPVAGLPLNPNGKVDRRALRELPLDAEPAAPGGIAPRTPLEAALAGIWAMTLGVPHVGVEDDFFALGGDSLTATRLAAHLREALAVDVRQRMVFEAPTVGALAALISAERSAPAEDARQAAEPTRAPVTSSQRRMWVLHKMAPSGAAYNDPVVLRLEGKLDPAALLGALRRIVRRHATLRTTIGSEDGRPVQIVAPPGTADALTLGITDLSGRPESALRRAVAELAGAPFDLTRGPLLRAALLRAGPDDHVLVLVFHHIVFDGWSMDVLFRELSHHYREALTGVPAGLPPLPVQYADHAVGQSQQHTGPAMDRQLDYWREKLAGAPPVTRLPPTRVAADSVGGPTGATVHPFSVGPDVAARLRELAATERVTPFMVLLAGFLALVHRAGGARDMVVGTLLSGRDRPETVDLIGLFTRTLALRTRLPAGATFRRFLPRVKETVQEAMAHQDVPFDRVVEEVRPARGRHHSPVFQLMFSYGSTTVRSPDLPGLTVTPLRADTRSAKFDATVMLEEGDDGGYDGLFEYDLALYDDTTARHLTDTFAALLESVAKDPDLLV